MLNEEIRRYAKLTGKEYDVVNNTPVCAIGSYLDGYNKAIDDVFKKAKEMQLEQIKNLEQSSKRNGKMWARYMITYLGHIENTCKRLLKDGEKNDKQ